MYFDGRKDQTLIITKKGNTSYSSTIVEEHITILSEPGCVYIGHVTPQSSNADDISKAIFDFCSQNAIVCDYIKIIGCDGTAVNTGSKGGVIQKLKEKLRRPLQWFICLLHFNELPLRHLIQDLHDATRGPRQFKGAIGSKLEGCEKLPIVQFKSVQNNLPLVHAKQDLSSDQNYLVFQIVSAISVGNVSCELNRKNLDKMSHARWLTTANRILRLYVLTRTFSEN